jgi:hypothetical protein
MKKEVFLVSAVSRQIPKIIIGIGWLKIADTNKCPVSKALLVLACLGWPTPLSSVQVENNI